MSEITVHSHTFNAVLVGNDASNLNSYIFVDLTKTADKAKVFGPTSPHLDLAVGRHGHARLELPTSYLVTKTGRQRTRSPYISTVTRSFFRGPKGAFVQQRVSRKVLIDFEHVTKALFLSADYDSWELLIHRRNRPGRAKLTRFLFNRMKNDRSPEGREEWAAKVARWSRDYVRHFQSVLGRHLTTESLDLVKKFSFGKPIGFVPEGPTWPLTETRLITILSGSHTLR